MKQYDQTKDKRTKYSCTIYTMLNILKFDYGIVVKDDTIYKIVAYMEKIGALLPKWAYFAVIYPAMCTLINLRTWLKLKIKKSSITRWLDDKSMWWIWTKKLSASYLSLWKDDYWISTDDIRKIAKDDKGSGHNHWIKQSNSNAAWILLENWGGLVFRTWLKALREWVKLWVYYDTARTLIPADDRTAKLQKKCIALVKKRWRLITYEEFKKMLK